MPTMPTLPASGRELGEPVVDHDRVAYEDAAAEADTARPVAPDLRTHRLAREARRREARLHAPEPRRIVAAQRAQQRMAGDTEGAEAMQDRAREAGHRGDLGIGVQRVVVAAEPVDEGGLRQGRDVADEIRRALPQRVNRARPPARPP